MSTRARLIELIGSPDYDEDGCTEWQQGERRLFVEHDALLGYVRGDVMCLSMLGFDSPQHAARWLQTGRVEVESLLDTMLEVPA